MSFNELLTHIYSNPQALFDYLHPDFILYAPGQNRIAGIYNGAEGMKAHMELMNALSSNTFMLLPTGTIIADESYGLVVTRAMAERNGRKLDMAAFGIWRLEGGLITAHWESVEDPVQWDAFWS